MNEGLSEVQRLFDQAGRLQDAERQAFLRDACGSNEALRVEVTSLLRSAGSSGRFLEGSAIEGILPGLGSISDPASLVGQTVGSYRIEQLVGVGGMGVVYLARQGNPDRLVALKLLRPGLATPRLVQRLQDEAEVLARLHHPGIAQIFEAGCTSLDSWAQPYFAMEFVDGESLLRYASARNLALPDRIELLARVCDALHHAHQHGVIHRDLKPQNILVVDEEAGPRPGQPKIIDFGVAKVVDEDDAARSDRITVDRLVGTLAYMSPEQFEDPRGGVDIRSDIYAVGVIGCELLTGELPYDLPSPSIGAAARTITEAAPIPPGRRSRALRGDLDIILMTALARAKELRYQSASGLAADLRHFLRSEPIAARPPSFWYQLSRHARRNKLLTATVAAAFLLLVAGAIGTSIGLVRARKAYDESQAVTAFLGRIIASANPYVAGKSDASMEEVVARLSRALDGEFQDNPLVRATLQHFVGCTLRGQGRYDEAATQLRTALDTRRVLLGPDDPQSIESMVMLADADRQAGALKESEALLVEALERRERLLGDRHPDSLDTCLHLARTYIEMDRLQDARSLLEAAWKRSEAIRDDHDDLTLSLAYWIGTVRLDQGDFENAEPLLRRVYEARTETLGDSHLESLAAASRLALAWLWLGRMGDARDLATRTYELQRSLLGDDHPDTINTAVALGEIAINEGHFEEAAGHFTAAAEGSRKHYGPEHPRVLQAQLSVGRAYRYMGRLEDAAAIAAEVRTTAIRVRGEDSLIALNATQVLCLSWHDLKRYDEAQALWRDLIEKQRRVFGPSHHKTIDSMYNLASSLALDESRRAEALALFEQVLELRRQTLGPEHPRTLQTLNGLARMYELQGRLEEAQAMMAQTIEVGRRVLPKDHWHLGLWLRRQGACLAGMQRWEEAQRALEEAVEILERGEGQERSAEARRARKELAEVREALSHVASSGAGE